MQVGQTEVVPILQLGIPSVCHEDDVLLDVLLHYEPRAATQTEPLALTNGVEPVTTMGAHHFTCFDVDDTSLLFAQEATQEIVVVYLAQETDALTVLAACRGQSCPYGNIAYLLLHQVSDGEDGVCKLFVRKLRQEVRLVLHRVFGCPQPNQSTLFDTLGIVSCGNKVVILAYALFEGSELDKAVAHDIGIGGQPLLHSLYGIAHHLFPIFFLQVGDLQLQAVFASGGLRQFNVLLCRAR